VVRAPAEAVAAEVAATRHTRRSVSHRPRRTWTAPTSHTETSRWFHPMTTISTEMKTGSVAKP